MVAIAYSPAVVESSSPWQSARFRWYYAGSVTSWLGSSMAPVGLAFAVLAFSKSGSALGLVLAARSIPLICFMVLGGEPSDALCGTSAALGWRQAITHGLLQHCVSLTVSGSSSQARQPSPLTAEHFGQDPDVRFLASMVKAAGLDLTLHDITGPAGIPVVACASTSGETVYAGGAHLAEAVREALTAALFRYQLRSDPHLRAANPAPPSAIWTQQPMSASIRPDRLVRALTSLGYTPSVVVLDHDRAVHEAFPYVLRVILEQRAAD